MLTCSKQRSRDNHYTVVQGDPPTAPNSIAIDDDGNDYSYFISMDVGAENKTMWMLLDTGGNNSWMFGSNCTANACAMHNTFGTNDSNTLQMTATPFDVGYGTGTVSGDLGTDSVSFAGDRMQFTFGLAANASSDFKNYPMDGILGLGRSNSSSTSTTTFMNAVANAKLLTSNVIGISLQRNSDGAKDGEITFGGIDNTKFTGNLSYTNTSPGIDRWEIPLDDASVGGTAGNFSRKSAIIDTGTSYIFLPPPDASALHALIPGSSPSGDSFNIPCKSTTVVAFTFSGVTYGVSPKDYVGAATDSTGNTCVSNIIGVQTFGPDDWLLGDVFLKNVYSVFDFDQNRIGLAIRPSSPTVKSDTTSTTPTTSGTATAAPAASTTTNSPTAAQSSGSATSTTFGGAASAPDGPRWALLATALSTLCLTRLISFT
jgi:cathepsin D